MLESCPAKNDSYSRLDNNLFSLFRLDKAVSGDFGKTKINSDSFSKTFNGR